MILEIEKKKSLEEDTLPQTLLVDTLFLLVDYLFTLYF